MKKIFLLVNLFVYLNISSQNLVPNPGFEYHTPNLTCNCCSNSGVINNCNIIWTRPTNTSPDFFGTCCQSLYPGGIPSNHFGFQPSHSGIHYCGLDLYEQHTPIPWPYSYREYIQTPLFIKLDSNKTYYIQFYVNLADSSNHALSNIGIFFSDTLIHYPNSPVIHMLNFIPQFQNPDSNIITNKIEWIEINGTYLATGGENYIVVGNFYNDANSNLITVPGGITYPNFAYYYIDDILIRRLDTIHYPAIAGNDTLICYGDSIKLGLYNFSDYNYQWSPTNGVILSGISNDTMGTPWVKPTVTTTYYLNQTDNYGLQSIDSITVYVDCYPADAGADTAVICYGDSIQLGTHNFAWYEYIWNTSYGLGDSTQGNTYAKPLNNMQYILTVVDTLGHTTIDTIEVYVINCYTANAGTDTAICKDDTLTIGSHNFSSYQYSWQSAVGSQQVFGNISDSTIGTPMVWPDTTTMFYLTVIDSIGNVSYDSVLITVVDCDTLGVEQLVISNQELVIYPNPANEVAYVEIAASFQLPASSFEITDMFGKVMLKEDLEAGKYIYTISVKELPEGMYVLRVMSVDFMVMKKIVVMR